MIFLYFSDGKKRRFVTGHCIEQMYGPWCKEEKKISSANANAAQNQIIDEINYKLFHFCSYQ